tara:strand:- start:159 stop:509 length:351 start_codon:yes stop_codon:yes gene_type:complete
MNSVYSKSFKSKSLEMVISENQVIDKIKTVFDPEIPVNIYDLGLIYNLLIDNKNNIEIKMTLTTPNCPVADTMPSKVGEAISTIEGISSIKVELVWDPQWTKNMMSEDAKLALDIF